MVFPPDSLRVRHAAMLAGQLTLAACSAGEAGTKPAASSGGAAQSAAGMGQGHGAAGGSGGVPAGGQGAGAGASHTSAGASSAGAGRGGAATGGAGPLGMAGSLAGGAGDPGTQAGGMNAGTAGSSGGSPPTAGTGAGGAESSAGSGSQPLSFEADIWPRFAEVRDPVFVYHDGSTYESCVTTGVCHGGLNPGAGLRMPDAETAYGMLIDRPSATELCAGTIRVVAGKPDESCLILFYEGRLRDELDWVDNTEIDRVRQWIADGALP